MGATTTTPTSRTLHAPPRAPDDPLAPLLARAAAGDEGSFRDLYDATSAQIFGLALGILRDRGLAEDTAIEVYVQVWKRAVLYDPARGSIRSWILMLARSRAIDQLRARTRAQGREQALERAASEPDPRPGPERLSMDSERAGRVRRAIETLPIEQRRVLEAAYFQGLSHSEVAAALDQPLGTVKTRIRAALAALRLKLSALEEHTS